MRFFLIIHNKSTFYDKKMIYFTRNRSSFLLIRYDIFDMCYMITFETNTIHVSLYSYVLLKEFLGKSHTSIHTVNTGFTFKSLYLNKSIFVLIFHHFFLFPCVSRPYNLFELRSNQNGTIYYIV